MSTIRLVLYPRAGAAGFSTDEYIFWIYVQLFFVSVLADNPQRRLSKI